MKSKPVLQMQSVQGSQNQKTKLQSWRMGARMPWELCYCKPMMLNLSQTQNADIARPKRRLQRWSGVSNAFQTYLIDRQFNLLADCKALIFLFSPTSRPRACIKRWVLRLQGFQYRISHIPGNLNVADVLSRLSTLPAKPFDEGEELMVREIVDSAITAVALKWEDLEKASKDDPQIQQIF